MRAKLVCMFAVAVVLAFGAALAKAPAPSAQEADNPDAPDTTATPTFQNPDKSYFVVRCDLSHRNTDDPIVYPGVQGAAHSHDFFGNRSTIFSSTHDSLRNFGLPKKGKKAKKAKAITTCRNPADKSAYWIPTVKRDGQDLTADRGLFYYQVGGKDPATIKPFPAGLKVVPNTNVSWRCQNEAAYSTDPPTQCPNGQLNARIDFPDCSNGELDSADHRSHMSYSVRQSAGGPRQCPDTHPTPVPKLTASIRFPIPTSIEGKVTLSSGEASTMHADFFNTWHQETLAGLVTRCLNEYSPTTREHPKECKIL